MKMLMIGAGAVVALLLLSAFIAVLVMYSRPGVRYLAYMSGIVRPGGFIREETTIRVGKEDVPLMVYRRPGRASTRNFFLVHGLTHEAHKHPQIDRMASSISGATGMSVYIPRISGFLVKGLTSDEITTEIADAYTAVAKKYPGTYRAFGACFGATALIAAMKKVDPELYPKKILLYGPFMDGKKLIHFYNSINADIDFIVKLGVSAEMDIYTDEEKKLLRKAIALSGPGKTDETMMRQIIGEKLFRDISVVKLRQERLEAVGAGTLFGNRKLPDCAYYILHSEHDTIIPVSEGKSLFQYLRSRGASARFYGTELFSHTENRVTVTGFVKEIAYMGSFFDDFFRD